MWKSNCDSWRLDLCKINCMFVLLEMFTNSYKLNEMKYVMLLICVNKRTHCPYMAEGFLNDCTHTDEKFVLQALSTVHIFSEPIA